MINHKKRVGKACQVSIITIIILNVHTAVDALPELRDRQDRRGGRVLPDHRVLQVQLGRRGYRASQGHKGSRVPLGPPDHRVLQAQLGRKGYRVSQGHKGSRVLPGPLDHRVLQAQRGRRGYRASKGHRALPAPRARPAPPARPVRPVLPAPARQVRPVRGVQQD